MATTKLASLRGGVSLSCGCLQREIATTHGESRVGAYTPEYNAWSSMRRRCAARSGDKFRRYGARGITVCDRWRESFENFLADMGRKPTPKHSIDRVDNDGNYEPSNCRWATAKEQQRNRGFNRLVTIGGKERCVSEWAEVAGITHGLIQHRLAVGVSGSDLLLPPQPRRGPRRAKTDTNQMQPRSDYARGGGE